MQRRVLVFILHIKGLLEQGFQVSFEISDRLVVITGVHEVLEFLEDCVAFSRVKVFRLGLKRLELEEKGDETVITRYSVNIDIQKSL
jgi:hypothetical protein